MLLLLIGDLLLRTTSSYRVTRQLKLIYQRIEAQLLGSAAISYSVLPKSWVYSTFIFK